MNKNLFNSIKLTKPRGNVFDLTHDVKLSLDMGELVPIMVQECVPGDHYELSCDSLLRFAPLVSPVMHRFDVSMHYFFVPNRLVFDGWEDFITGGGDFTLPPLMYYNAGHYTRLMDYMGLPALSGDNTLQINPMALAAYQCVYNEYYRDQNLVEEINYKLIPGENIGNIANLGALRRRAWTHDYFTSALPFAQAGGAVDIPIGDVKLKDSYTGRPEYKQWQTNDPFNGDGIGTVRTEAVTGVPGSYTGGVQVDFDSSPTNQLGVYDPKDTLGVQATTINDLRRSFRLQEWLEKAARGGRRYVETILSHFGVKSSDARLQRPEYITGTKSPVIISEVLNTTGEVIEGNEPQGTMAGHAVAVTSGKYGKYFCEEHGYIIGVMSVMPQPAYQQGVPRHWLRSDKFDYFWPEFANIGEQNVSVKELYADAPDTVQNALFGYVPRYAEYKYTPSRVAGDFKTSLDYWHFGRIFSNPPALNQNFIECNPGKRIFAVEGSENSLYCQVLNKVRAVRPMPKFGTPSF